MNQEEQDEALSALLRQHAQRHAAPEELRAALHTQIALADAKRADAPSSHAPNNSASKPGSNWLPRWPRLAFEKRTASLSFALGVACTLLVLPSLQQQRWATPLDAELVADHVRALQVGPLTEVVSTDRHTVKPWFQGRLDYAPPVFDLSEEGFPLMGGRIEQVRGETVATLAYARNRHVIDVFVWPTESAQALQHLQRRGFHVLHWADGAMQVWAVSDLERSQMEKFAQLWQERAARQ